MTEYRKPMERADDESGKDTYPPPLSYEWISIDALFDEDVKASLKNVVDEFLPGYQPRETAQISGRMEEQKIVNLAASSAKHILDHTENDFPLIESYEPYTDGNIVRKHAAAAWMFVTFTENDKKTHGFIFAQYKGATNAQYIKARDMFLTTTNEILGEIKRNKIPLPPKK